MFCLFSFGIHFFICNLVISGILTGILLAKRVLRKHLSARRQYQIWFLLPAVLAVPFLSIRPEGLDQILFRLMNFQTVPADTSLFYPAASPVRPSSSGWINDFTVSVTREMPSMISFLPLTIWISGILVMSFFMLRSKVRLYRLERSALPIQSKAVQDLFKKCLSEMNISREIPVYSTAFLNSPIMVGLLQPRIYLPIRLISDLQEADMRYMLLHELQHYKHKDALMNHLLNAAVILYWFNPLIWYAVKEARSDREIACDASVLQMLNPEEYTAYGNTLLNFARKISRSPFSMAAGMGGSVKQLKKRILHIAFYKPESKWQRRKEQALFLFLTLLICESTAYIPVLAAEEKSSLPADAVVMEEDLSFYFSGYDGCFVLYDLKEDTWKIYNKEHALQRFSPDSTYKIYSALSALENGIITPDASFMKWNGENHPIPQWNQDQTLASAIRDSVNWYFQSLDQTAGIDSLARFYEEIDYGNQDLSGGISEFWLESSLKISPLEQVEMLKKLYTNEFAFDEQNIQTVKNTLLITSNESASLYGKTGTGNINGQNINGWFIGYEEAGDNAYFFASNIQAKSDADGLTASNITRKILEDQGLVP